MMDRREFFKCDIEIINNAFRTVDSFFCRI